MKLKTPKKCGGCKAFMYGHCELYFKMKTIFIMDAPVNGVPQEPCFKPTTAKQLIDCMEIRRNEKSI